MFFRKKEERNKITKEVEAAKKQAKSAEQKTTELLEQLMADFKKKQWRGHV